MKAIKIADIANEDIKRQVLEKIGYPVAVPSAVMESHTRDESVGAQKAPQMDPRCSIHFRQFRKRLCDSDGASGKAVIDGLQLCGILEDDSAVHVKEVTYSQEVSAEEYTIIEITREVKQ